MKEKRYDDRDRTRCRAGSRQGGQAMKDEKEKSAVAGAKKPLTLTLSRWPRVDEKEEGAVAEREGGEENEQESRNVKLS